jgi:hypothetical protein
MFLPLVAVYRVVQPALIAANQEQLFIKVRQTARQRRLCLVNA